MKITLWGTRGSVPVSGPAFVRHGGSTTCVSVEVPGSPSMIVIDCGTGLIELGRAVHDWSDTLVLQTHLHWDHVQGFPFFAPLFRQTSKLHFLAVDRDTETLRDVLEGQMSPPTFPVTLGILPADLTFESVPETGRRELGEVQIRWEEMNHPSGSSGYRIDADGASFVFSGDVEVQVGCRERLIALAQNADVLVMDAQYFPDEYAARVGWGHSTPLDAVEVALAAGARRLVMTHHDPSHDDRRLEEKLVLAREHARGTGLVVDNAHDRMSIELSGRSRAAAA